MLVSLQCRALLASPSSRARAVRPPRRSALGHSRAGAITRLPGIVIMPGTIFLSNRSIGRIALLPVILLPLFVAACADDAQPPRGGTVTVVTSSGLGTALPLLAASTMDHDLRMILFRPLLQDWWEDGRLHHLTHAENPAALARSWEYVGADSAAIRFHLVRGARWSDGAPITAHDAAWTIEMRGHPETGSPRADYNRRIVSVEAEDDHTLLVRFDSRYAEMLFHATTVVVPRHAFEGVDAGGLRTHRAVADPAAHLPVSGSFALSRWDRGREIVLVPNRHFEPVPRLDRIVFRVVPEETSRLVELQTGGADLLAGVPYRWIDRLGREMPELRFEQRKDRHLGYVAWNPARFEPFTDPEVRRALGLAIDHDRLLAALDMDRHGRAAGGPYAPILPDLYDPEAQAPLPHDPDEARRLLATAGFAPGPDGTLRRDGEPFRFTVITNAGNQHRADAAQILQQMLRQVGVDMRIRSLEFNTYVQQLFEREADAVLGSWEVALSPDLSPLWTPGMLNITGYENPRVAALIDRALDEPTREAAAPHWRDAAGLIAADHPYAWLYYRDDVVAVRNRLRGTTINSLGTFQKVWEWWVDAGER
jgi:peptide/nickel transport system substrate-binding protein